LLPVTKPNFSAREVFEACCDGISDPGRKQRLTPNAAKVELAAGDYSTAGLAGTINNLQAATYEPLGSATTADFVWLYDTRLVGSPRGRMYYELLRDANRNGRCALCNVRPVSTLDHHLPKRKHPVFAVTPDNLLPACGDCNKTKLEKQIPILNAYFDDLGPGPWLRVAIVPTNPWVPEFSLQVQATWSSDLAARAEAHFDLFGLQEFYAFQASRQISGIRQLLGQLFAAQGVGGVQKHLYDTAQSWQLSEPNSWEAALYGALAASEWFCAGGFAQ
jgi:hypothetical protein